jgi:hypothetical protein
MKAYRNELLDALTRQTALSGQTGRKQKSSSDKSEELLIFSVTNFFEASI